MPQPLLEFFAFIGITLITCIVIGTIYACIDDWKEHHKGYCPKCTRRADKWYYDYCPYCGSKLIK